MDENKAAGPIGEDRPATVRECQLYLLGILRKFDKACRENGWTYWLDGGTLLGAVRHKGFIPWDDDVDLVMPRKDFEDFKKRGQAALDKDLFLQSMETDRFHYGLYFKVRDRNSTYVEDNEKHVKIPYHQGVFIDVYPIDVIRRDRVKTVLEPFKSLEFSFFLGKKIYWPRTGTLKDLLKTLLLLPLQLVRLFFRDRYEFSRFFYRRIYKKYAKKYFSDSGDGIYFKPFYCLNFPKLYFEKDDLFPVKPGLFEGEQFPVPAKPERYLELQYGDYMKLPPEEKRGRHSFAVYLNTPCDHKESRTCI